MTLTENVLNCYHRIMLHGLSYDFFITIVIVYDCLCKTVINYDKKVINYNFFS